jgi:probable phosphoglycerate mutase
VTNIIDLENPFRKSQMPQSRDAIQHQIEDLFRLDDDSATELILVRHAEPARNETGVCQDPLLSCCGLAQAERLAERLGPIWVEALYAAPERRAQQTAHILGEATGRDVQTVEALREIEYEPGDACEGSVSQRFVEEPRWDSLPGFMPSRDFRLRALQAIEALVAAHPGRRIVVVTHASVINAYLSAVLGIERDVFFAPEHTSICCLHSLGELYALRSLNDISHLAGHIGRTR